MPASASPVFSLPARRGTRQIRDIIFLIEYPFARWDYDRFGIDTLRRAGFTVQVWNLASVLYGHCMREIAVSDPTTFPGLRVFHRKRDVIAAIQSADRACMAICFVTYRLESLSIFRGLTRAGIPYAVASNNIVPSPPRSTARRAWNIVRKFRPRRLAEAALMRMPCEPLGVQPAALLLAGGARSRDVTKPVARKARVAWLHAWDYDAYLRARAAPAGEKPLTGVFLDEFYPYHADYAIDGTRAPITAEEYYPRLRNFFDSLESVYGGHVAIAAHPRARYEDIPDCFGGRTVIRGRTAELVRDARFVIAHSSTSINLAVLFRKPVIFITCKTLRSTRWGKSIDVVASALGKTPVDLTGPTAVDFDRECAVDEAAYAAYQHNYIKKNGTPELPFWQQFVEYVRNL